MGLSSLGITVTEVTPLCSGCDSHGPHLGPVAQLVEQGAENPRAEVQFLSGPLARHFGLDTSVQLNPSGDWEPPSRCLAFFY